MATALGLAGSLLECRPTESVCVLSARWAAFVSLAMPVSPRPAPSSRPTHWEGRPGLPAKIRDKFPLLGRPLAVELGARRRSGKAAARLALVIVCRKPLWPPLTLSSLAPD